MAQTPMCHISDSVYKTSADWISQKSAEALGNFSLWCLDNIFADLASQQAAAKGSKKPAQQPSSKSQVYLPTFYPCSYLNLLVALDSLT